MRLLLAFTILVLLGGCSEGKRTIAAGRTMGTAWSLQAHVPFSPTVKAEVQRHLDVWEGMLSHWQPRSDLSRFNATFSTQWIEVPKELVEVVELAQQIGNDTDHALDITVAPLVDLWGFGATGERGTVPSAGEIAAAKAECGWQHLHTRHDPPALRKDLPWLRINVSAVTEGWALDQLAQHLTERGMTDFLLDVGGEVLVRGEWRVDIQKPTAPPGEAKQTLLLKDQSLATSGIYRQRFSQEGKEYSHIIDPVTGRPIEHALGSVSVIDPSAAQADGWATALLVLGPVKGRELAHKRGLQVVWFERTE